MKTDILITSAILLTCFWGAANQAAAQTTTTATKQLPTYIGELRGFIGEGLGQFRTVPADEVDLNEPMVIGNTFLNDNWEKGILYLTLNRKLENQQLKYDIEQNQFLLLKQASPNPKEVPDKFDAISGVSVLAYEIENPQKDKKAFLNSANAGFTDGGTPYPGFLEVLVEGPLNLYRQVKTSILRASYNVALDAGEKKDRIIKKESFFIRRAGEKELHEISKNKKDNLKLFDKQQQVESFLKKHNLKFQQQEDLVELVNHYNSL
jgi:hypothetical protein